MTIRKVAFALEKTGSQINYPDDKSLFLRTHLMTINGVEMVIGDYIGNLPIEDFVMPEKYRIRLRPGEIISLLGQESYTNIVRGADPKGDETPDDGALGFLDQAKFPTAEDGRIDITSEEVGGALDYFVSKGYIKEEDRDRVLMGVLVKEEEEGQIQEENVYRDIPPGPSETLPKNPEPPIKPPKKPKREGKKKK